MTDAEGQGAPAPERIVRVRIGGRVHGVGYRAWTQDQAKARGVKGWVRNRRDGDVEAVLAGSAAAVDALCALLWRGPRAARVTRVEASPAGPEDLDGSGGGFRQIATV
ncbi:acylphosphatase [Methylocella silvestris BL2]|uniref:acylphosphatase n=1 Tax=Methylocella silvestris (strain DSM 15510 / CIP 108128 / LMG 27833 / NCIMB 13906 / BL2) TaxID=395965 RepID=B8EL73_METSB|nr:acylphosphatase [Methylocella silvestris]ACK49068.1 acylphosphatase [Methylocella silvestris BL2]